MCVCVAVVGVHGEWDWCAGEWKQCACGARAALSGHPGGVQTCLWTELPPARSSLPAPLRLPFPWHLLMIAVPVVYNYQFDKFRSSLLIIIISFHSVRLQEFNNNINNGGRRSGIDYKEMTGKTSFCCQETHP